LCERGSFKVTKRKVVTPHVDEELPNPNPPTEEVPEESIPLPEEPVGVQPESAPVWEGGDPGVAVPSPNDTPDAYHPEPDVPPEMLDGDTDEDRDGITDDLDPDDDNDGILDGEDDDVDGDGIPNSEENPPVI
jgi:hypothetical protein